MAVNLTIHRGTDTVGGSCIEVATTRTRLILDLGLPLFDVDRQPLNSYQIRRMTTAELATSGHLPKVAGLFEDGPAPDAILLSHAHMDHTGLLDRTTPDIPVYATAGCSKMMLAGSLFANQNLLPRDRFRELKPEQPIVIGDFTVTPYSVDHSVFDCVALLIEAEGKSMLYTGDLRLHGRKPGMSNRLVEVFQNRKLDVLLQEGTHFGLDDGDPKSEYELEAEIVEQASQAKGLVLASFSPQHVDRLVGFIRAAKKTGRTFVADFYAAFILHLIASQTPVPVPGKDSDLRVFFPGLFIKSARRRRISEKFERLFNPSRIDQPEILSDPSKYLMVFRPSMMPNFEDGLPPETLCIYSRWEGYLEEPEWKELRNPAARNSLRVVTLHTSGHIFSQDIVRFVEAIAPQTIVPVHTFQPEEFARRFPNVRLPRDGESFEIL